MAKKLNPALLQEELKKFKLLCEYTFYTEKEENKDNDLILGSGLDEANDDPEAPEAQDPAAQPAPPEAPADVAPDASAAPEAPADDNLFDTGAEAPETAAAPAMPASDDVEVDVTQLVQSGEKASQEAIQANQKSSELLSKFEELEKRISSMDNIGHKIETLEKEIIKRNPTPVEKLEMRSLDSFPFNIKISDYWKDVEGYDAQGESIPKEYTLTKDDVDNDFTDVSIKKSLNSPEPYDEEEIY